MADDMVWEQISERTPSSPGWEQALTYKVTHHGYTYHVHLLITEHGRYVLHGHHVKDDNPQRRFEYRLLPYMRGRNPWRGETPQFATQEEAKAFVDQQTRGWEAAQRGRQEATR